DGGSTLPIAEVLGAYRPGRRVYLCGPAGFMSWVLTEAERLGWPPGAVRTESFTPTADERPPRAFEVYLQRSRKTLKVREDQTLLQVLEDARAGLPSNCTAGLCGACVCGVLEGEVEHRDSILTAAEKAQNAVMYPCVSRAAGARITLDL
ncbi:MAG: 2Fe-2S iron-sulfur cluster-binding protein, partial [Myxococcota bacterium]